MTYGAIIQCRESRANQYGPTASAQEQRSFSSGVDHGANVWPFKTPSLSLSKRGPRTHPATTNTGTQNRLYRQAATAVGGDATRPCASAQPTTQQAGHRGVGGVSSATRRAQWLNTSPARRRLPWNIVLIDCWRTNWSKSTNSWYRTMLGRRDKTAAERRGA